MEDYSTFRDKTDWLNSSLDTMQKLTASAMADTMQKGEGVILTSDEVLNGTVGIKSDSNGDVIDKFLKVYPSLDGIELSESDLISIEEKLSMDDGQFDSWLQTKLPQFLGQDEVSDVLDNEMFDKFEPMGGEEEPEELPEMEFDEFMEKASSEAGQLPTEESEEEEKADRKAAELEVGETEVNEFPNV